jgi:hypothetical protein
MEPTLPNVPESLAQCLASLRRALAYVAMAEYAMIENSEWRLQQCVSRLGQPPVERSSTLGA